MVVVSDTSLLMTTVQVTIVMMTGDATSSPPKTHRSGAQYCISLAVSDRQRRVLNGLRHWVLKTD